MAAATFSCLMKNDGRVLWSPAADSQPEDRQGQWVTVKEACFVPAGKPSDCLINVGRRAGLHVVQISAPIAQVQPLIILACRLSSGIPTCSMS